MALVALELMLILTVAPGGLALAQMVAPVVARQVIMGLVELAVPETMAAQPELSLMSRFLAPVALVLSDETEAAA